MSKRRPRNKGGKRSHLKRFSGTYVNAGKQANSAYLSDLFAHTRSLKEIGLKDYSDYMTSLPPKSQMERADPLDVVYGRLKDLWRGDFVQGIRDWKRINVVLSPDRNMFLFFSGELWFFVAEYPWRTSQNRDVRFVKGESGVIDLKATPEYGFCKRSIVYPSKETAIAALNSPKGPFWIEKKHLKAPLLDGQPKPKLNMEFIKITKSGA